MTRIWKVLRCEFLGKSWLVGGDSASTTFAGCRKNFFGKMIVSQTWYFVTAHTLGDDLCPSAGTRTRGSGN